MQSKFNMVLVGLYTNKDLHFGILIVWWSIKDSDLILIVLIGHYFYYLKNLDLTLNSATVLSIYKKNLTVIHSLINMVLYGKVNLCTVIYFLKGSMGDFISLWRDKRLIYGDSIDMNLSYWNLRHHPNVLIITFEEAQEDIMGVLRKMSTFLNKSLSDELLEKIKQHVSFDNMQENASVNSVHNPTIKGNFIRKGKVSCIQWYNI